MILAILPLTAKAKAHTIHPRKQETQKVSLGVQREPDGDETGRWLPPIRFTNSRPKRVVENRERSETKEYIPRVSHTVAHVYGRNNRNKNGPPHARDLFPCAQGARIDDPRPSNERSASNRVSEELQGGAIDLLCMQRDCDGDLITIVDCNSSHSCFLCADRSAKKRGDVGETGFEHRGADSDE